MEITDGSVEKKERKIKAHELTIRRGRRWNMQGKGAAEYTPNRRSCRENGFNRLWNRDMWKIGKGFPII